MWCSRICLSLPRTSNVPWGPDFTLLLRRDVLSGESPLVIPNKPELVTSKEPRGDFPCSRTRAGERKESFLQLRSLRLSATVLQAAPFPAPCPVWSPPLTHTFPLSLLQKCHQWGFGEEDVAISSHLIWGSCCWLVALPVACSCLVPRLLAGST